MKAKQGDNFVIFSLPSWLPDEVNPPNPQASIDALSRTFAELHGQLREEKEQRRVDLEHLTQTIGAKVEEAHSGLDDERVARLEREAQTLKRVGEDVFRVQVKPQTLRPETLLFHPLCL